MGQSTPPAQPRDLVQRSERGAVSCWPQSTATLSANTSNTPDLLTLCAHVCSDWSPRNFHSRHQDRRSPSRSPFGKPASAARATVAAPFRGAQPITVKFDTLHRKSNLQNLNRLAQYLRLSALWHATACDDLRASGCRGFRSNYCSTCVGGILARRPVQLHTPELSMSWCNSAFPTWVKHSYCSVCSGVQ